MAFQNLHAIKYSSSNAQFWVPLYSWMCPQKEEEEEEEETVQGWSEKVNVNDCAQK